MPIPPGLKIVDADSGYCGMGYLFRNAKGRTVLLYLNNDEPPKLILHDMKRDKDIEITELDP
jgi:hypothetical protein